MPDEGSARTLREWRAERLLSIRDLARLAGVAPSMVYLIEAGQSVPHPTTIRAIAAFRAAIAARARPH